MILENLLARQWLCIQKGFQKENSILIAEGDRFTVQVLRDNKKVQVGKDQEKTQIKKAINIGITCSIL